MKEKTEDLVKLWLKKASDDLKVAVRLFESGDMPMAIVCFHCQQAVEKGLKALIVAQGGVPPKTHDLLALCNQCTMSKRDAKIIQDCVLDFMEYAAELRYPGDYEPDATEASAAVVHAKKVHRVLRKDLRTARSKIAG